MSSQVDTGLKLPSVLDIGKKKEIVKPLHHYKNMGSIKTEES